MSANSHCSSAVKGKWELRWGHNSCKKSFSGRARASKNGSIAQPGMPQERARMEEGRDFRLRYETSPAHIGRKHNVSRIHAGCVSPVDARYASPFARKSAETGQIS
jgi:hypothetical protein